MITVKSKGGKIRSVPIPTHIRPILETLLDRSERGHKLLVPDDKPTDRAIKELQDFLRRKRAMIQDPEDDRPLTFHGLRHSYASDTYRNLLGDGMSALDAHVHIDEKSLEDNSSILEVKQELKRCYKTSLEDLEMMNRGNVYFKFPDVKECSNTSVVLKIPKTESSICTVYIPNSVDVALQAQRIEQEKQKELLHGLYSDYGMVIAQDDGRPTEGRVIDRTFKQLIVSNGLPEVVFHSLRHLSTSMKLQVSGGDIKAVQGDTGYAQASMVTQVYSHTFVENRKRMAGLMEDTSFSGVKGDAADNSAVDAKKEQILHLLKESPELADLILAIAGGRKAG